MAVIKLRHVNRFRDRHGRMRYYFRRPGQRSVPLPGLPGSADFMEAYQRALSAVPSSQIGASRTLVGTVNAAIIAYYAHELFTDLASETQRMRRNILERFRERYGTYRIAAMQRDHVQQLLKGMKPHAKKNWLKTLRGLMAFAIVEELRKDDPTQGVTAKVKKSRGHLSWGDAEIAAYRQRHPLGSMARLALELLLNIAARRGDAHRLGPQHLRDGKIVFRPQKTLQSTGMQLEVPVIPDFQSALDAMPRKAGSLTFLTNDYGRPFASAAAFGNKFADWCTEAGLPAIACEDGLTRNYRAHGLRKAACRKLAEKGCTATQIMAISGHTSLAEAQKYIDGFSRSKAAEQAMKKLVEG